MRFPPIMMINQTAYLYVIEPRNYHCREPSSWTLAGAEPGN
jgi:hypothetical protein